MGEQTVRFAVGRWEGPRSSVFRLWTHGSDLYFAPRHIAGKLKVSFHSSGEWRSALTQGHLSKGAPGLVPGADRRPSVWRRPAEFEPGWTLALIVVVPSSQLGPSPDVERGDPGILWHPDPGPHMETRYFLFIAAPSVSPPNGWPGREGMKTQFVARLGLENEETAWLVVNDEASPEGNEQYYDEVKSERLQVTLSQVPAEQRSNRSALRGYELRGNEQLAVWIDLDYSDVRTQRD